MLTGEAPSLPNAQIGICQKPNAQFKNFFVVIDYMEE
jgi:hypothetical protein